MAHLEPAKNGAGSVVLARLATANKGIAAYKSDARRKDLICHFQYGALGVGGIGDGGVSL